MESKESLPQNIVDINEPGENLPTSTFSTPFTSSRGSAEWEQLSATETDQSTSSTEFEVLKGYNRVPIYERRAQWLAEQQTRREQKHQSSLGGTNYSGPKSFRPNSQLPFPITAQFLRYYGGDYGKHSGKRQSPQSDDSQRTVVAPANAFFTLPTTSYLSTPTSLPSSPESAPDISSFTRRRKLKEKKQGRPSPPSRKTSGIPSFTSLFESKWNWDRKPKPKNHDYSPRTSKEALIGGFLEMELGLKDKFEGVPPPSYWDKLESRISSVFGDRKRVSLVLAIFCSLVLTSFFVLTTSSPFSIGDSFPLSHHTSCNTTFPYTQSPYVDFPALISIESSLEGIVESATGGSALARLLKQGEMSVSDMGTIVKYSNLSCKKTLGEQLDRFAEEAREGVIALQHFESEVGEGLNQVLEANQDFLRDFTILLRQRRIRYKGVSFVPKGVEYPHIRIRLFENFDRTARLLNSNLKAIISSGKRVTKSLESLSQQHKPIYDEIVREFVNIERREETPWMRIGWESPRANVLRKMKIREDKQLLVLVGSYEERARGYVESILLELESMMSEMETLQKRVSEDFLNPDMNIKGSGVTEMPLGRQLEIVEQAVISMLSRRKQQARRPCLVGDVSIHRVKNETGSYRDIFTPTRTSEV